MSLDIFNKEIICPRCKTSNPANSNFCRKCRHPLSSEIKNTCPSCGAELPSGSNFCPKCGTNLTQSPKREATVNTSKELNKNNIWMRQPDDFAQKFELSDINGLFTKIVTVQQGTGALFVQDGVYKGMLPAGQYNVETLRRRIIGLFTNKTTTVILVDSAEIPLTFSFNKTELRTRDAYDIGASGQLTEKISEPLNFLENYLKGKDHISLTDIENTLHNELAQILRNTLSGYNGSELYGNAELTRKIGDEIRNTLNANLRSKGIEITLLNCIGFDEGAYLEVQKIRNQTKIDVDIARAEYERNIAFNQLRATEKIDRIDNGVAVKLHAVDGENRIKKEYQNGRHEREDAQLHHDLAHDKAIHDHELEKEKADFNQDFDEISRMKNLQADMRGRKIQDLDAASPEARILIAKDKTKIDALTKLEMTKRAASLSADQILAVQATDPVSAANAIAAKNSADEQKEINKRTVDLMNANADRDERILEKALDAMGKTATARATAQNPGATIVPGGMGAPVVVNTSPQNTKKCKNCGATLSEDDKFCTNCGADQ